MSKLFVTPFEFEDEIFKDLKVLIGSGCVLDAVNKVVAAKIEREREEHYKRGLDDARNQVSEPEPQECLCGSLYIKWLN